MDNLDRKTTESLIVAHKAIQSAINSQTVRVPSYPILIQRLTEARDQLADISFQHNVQY